MTTHLVRRHRESQYWVGVVDGLPGGATGTRMLADLEAEVRDLIAGLIDTDPCSFDLDLSPALPC